MFQFKGIRAKELKRFTRQIIKIEYDIEDRHLVLDVLFDEYALNFKVKSDVFSKAGFRIMTIEVV